MGLLGGGNWYKNRNSSRFSDEVQWLLVYTVLFCWPLQKKA